MKKRMRKILDELYEIENPYSIKEPHNIRGVGDISSRESPTDNPTDGLTDYSTNHINNNGRDHTSDALPYISGRSFHPHKLLTFRIPLEVYEELFAFCGERRIAKSAYVLTKVIQGLVRDAGLSNAYLDNYTPPRARNSRIAKRILSYKYMKNNGDNGGNKGDLEWQSPRELQILGREILAMRREVARKLNIEMKQLQKLLRKYEKAPKTGPVGAAPPKPTKIDHNKIVSDISDLASLV